MTEYATTVQKLADACGMTREHLTRRYMGIDGFPRKTKSGWNVALVKEFIKDDKKRHVVGDGTLRDEKLKREIVKLDIEIGRLREQLKPVEEWLSEVQELTAIIKVGLEQFVQRVAAEKMDPYLYGWAQNCRDDVLNRIAERVKDAQEQHGRFVDCVEPTTGKA